MRPWNNVIKMTIHGLMSLVARASLSSPAPAEESEMIDLRKWVSPSSTDVNTIITIFVALP